jgi:hypothetical protein
MNQPVYGQIKAGKGTLIGNAGEYFVVGELLRRGIVAALAPRNTPGFDVVAIAGMASANVRVKTRTAAADSWTWMAKTDGSIFRDVTENDFTVMVDLKKGDAPVAYYIVKSSELPDSLIRDYEKWLVTPGRGGRERRPHKMRRCGDWDPHRSLLSNAEGAWHRITDWLSGINAEIEDQTK